MTDDRSPPAPSDRDVTGSPRHAYLHGLGSSPSSRKGGHLARAFRRLGVPLERPDLNLPSFGRLSVAAMLASLDDLDARGGGGPWRIVGSSLGGYVAALWASRHPDRVDRLVLLCPAFDMAGRWPRLRPADEMRRWRETGWLEMADAQGRPTPVHHAFFEELQRLPPVPEVPCPALILHGTADDVVPVGSSRAYAARLPDVTLVEVADDHLLGRSLDLVVASTIEFFGLAGYPNR